jgi:DNA-directed RNA polymerase beta' subunit
MNDVKEIGSIIFGIYSPKEIIDMSVCKVDSNKLTGRGTVYDERMGPSLEGNLPCITCGKNPKDCPGHFGYIELNEAIIHPLFYKQVVAYLRCICIKCNRLLITKDQLALNGILKYKRERRFKRILDKLEKVDVCCRCSHPQPTISYSVTDNTISMVYKEKIATNDIKENENVIKISGAVNKISIALGVNDIKKIFDSFPDEDVSLCGFDPERIHPRSLILTVFPVIPPCARPFVIADGNICDDDLTNQLLEIIKSNNCLKDEDQSEKKICQEKRDVKRQKALQSLKFRISTFYNNSQGKAKHPTNGRAIKCLKNRITGKEGLLRSNLMGKRVNFSARTVIGPDPTLPFGWMGMPKEVAQELTIPERVTFFNKEYLTNIVNDGHANFIMTNNGNTRLNLKYAMFRRGTELLYGDIIIRDGKETKVINNNITFQENDQIIRPSIVKIGDIVVRGKKGEEKRIKVKSVKIPLNIGDKIERVNNEGESNIICYISVVKKKRLNLNLGDIVHRHIKDGDTVLLNRQPTLHKGSMLAKKVKVMPYKTFRMNLATTKTFNADFDGDEMNVHVPQSDETIIELIELSTTKENIISAQGSKPNIAVVQDSLLGAFLMTKNNMKLTQEQFFDISMNGQRNEKSACLWSEKKANTIREVLKMKGKEVEVFNGRGLFSLLLPEDFIYEKKNEAHSTEPYVRIYKGVMYEGALNKANLGASHNSIIQVLHKEYGKDVCADFISNIQFITNNWLLVHSFSIGLGDCLVKSQSSKDKIQDKISKCYFEADGIADATRNPSIREVRITASLSKAKDVGMKIAKDSMAKDNNFLSTVVSGSKGDFFNIAQLTGLLGQQNLQGQRVSHMINHGKRTLVHYPFGKLDREVEYESRGFIRHSFIEGLNPHEFFFHAMSGREGICDTAMGTAKTGYIQRRIIKVCEDIQVKYDGSVRDTSGKVYQMSYGDNGLNPTQTVKVGEEQQACDIFRMANRLNLQYEINKQDTETCKDIKKKSDKKLSRVGYLKAIATITGTRKLYKGLTIDQLAEKLEELELK